MPIDPFEHYPLGPDALGAVSALSLTWGFGLPESLFLLFFETLATSICTDILLY